MLFQFKAILGTGDGMLQGGEALLQGGVFLGAGIVQAVLLAQGLQGGYSLP